MKRTIGILLFPYIHLLLERNDRFFDQLSEAQIEQRKLTAYIGFAMHLFFFVPIILFIFFSTLMKVLPC
jgi:hypothetical protein